MKARKNQIIITALAIMIAIAGYINYTGNISDLISVNKSGSDDVAVNSDNEILVNDAEPDEESLTEPGSVVLTSGNTVESAVINEAKLNREQIRAKNRESLMNIIDNSSLDENTKQQAVTELAMITDNSEKEIAAEILLEAKGFNNAVVSVNEGTADAVINKNSLTDEEHAQIEDIIKRKTGLTSDKITINICNN